MKAVGLVSAWYLIFGYIFRLRRGPLGRRRLILGQVFCIRGLEEPAHMARFARRAVVLYGNHAVCKVNLSRRAWVRVDFSTFRAGRALLSCDAGSTQTIPAPVAMPEILEILDFVQFATGGANNDVGRMATVLGEYIAWEQVENMAATVAGKGLDPQEVLHVRLLV